MNPVDLATGYRAQLACAPRRAQGYLSKTHSGVTSSGDASNHTEEHLAIGLLLRGELALPNDEMLTLLDYQFPLKSKHADVGIGKVDLLGVDKNGTLAVVELKVAGNLEDRRIALLEGLIYAAVIEANAEKIVAEILAAKGIRIPRNRPKILVIAPPEFWADKKAYPPVDEFIALTSAIAQAISIEISLFCLNDATLLALGLNGQSPKLLGHAFLSPIHGAAFQPMPLQRLSEMAYRDDLHRRFWVYRRATFAANDCLFDPRHAEGKSPPVFRHDCAERNLLTPPGAQTAVHTELTAMILPVERHCWFASMASSQALAQSVFASLAVLGRLSALEGLAAEDKRPAFFETFAGYTLKLEHQVSTLGEPRPTSLDAFFDGPRKVAVEVKFTAAEFGRCSRTRLRPDAPSFARDHCDGSYSVQRDRKARCRLSEQDILYWQFVPDLFTWSAAEDHQPWPLDFTYQLVRNVLAVCVGADGVCDTNKGHTLLIYDARNPAFQPGGDGDTAWWATLRALRYPHLLRRVSWQRIATHLAQFPDLAWLTSGLESKYGFK